MLTHTLKAPGFNPWNLQAFSPAPLPDFDLENVITIISKFDFKCQRVPLHHGDAAGRRRAAGAGALGGAVQVESS
jgi:hypothetical protein